MVAPKIIMCVAQRLEIWGHIGLYLFCVVNAKIVVLCSLPERLTFVIVVLAMFIVNKSLASSLVACYLQRARVEER